MKIGLHGEVIIVVLRFIGFLGLFGKEGFQEIRKLSSWLIWGYGWEVIRSDLVVCVDLRLLVGVNVLDLK